jgi:hypothetical protein
MTHEKDTGGPAFPQNDLSGYGMGPAEFGNGGMTLRQYAAIQLKQPNSGIDWLDAMILAAKRDELATQALNGFLSDPELTRWDGKKFAEQSYSTADAMLEARK